jgi:hypothetical protein
MRGDDVFVSLALLRDAVRRDVQSVLLLARELIRVSRARETREAL